MTVIYAHIPKKIVSFIHDRKVEDEFMTEKDISGEKRERSDQRSEKATGIGLGTERWKDCQGPSDLGQMILSMT